MFQSLIARNLLRQRSPLAIFARSSTGKGKSRSSSTDRKSSSDVTDNGADVVLGQSTAPSKHQLKKEKKAAKKALKVHFWLS